MLGTTLADIGYGTIRVIKLHRVVDRQHGCSTDFLPNLNSFANLVLHVYQTEVTI